MDSAGQILDRLGRWFRVLIDAGFGNQRCGCQDVQSGNGICEGPDGLVCLLPERTGEVGGREFIRRNSVLCGRRPIGLSWQNSPLAVHFSAHPAQRPQYTLIRFRRQDDVIVPVDHLNVQAIFAFSTQSIAFAHGE